MKPWLWLPPLWSHFLSHYFLKCRGIFFKEKKLEWSSFQWKNLRFDNPLGTAAGLDKSAENIKGWWSLGPGFLEVGTVTPEKQEPHPGNILQRDIPSQALWNYMGFPNKGVHFVVEQLRQVKQAYHTPIFISIGKGRRTPTDQAVQDYKYLIKKLYPYASAFVLNISSPNTKDLRKLFDPHFFEHFIKSIVLTLRSFDLSLPLFLKINPDLSDQDFLRVVAQSDRENIDGWVICNTSIFRENGSFPPHGGVSGKPLASRSKHLLKLLVKTLGKRKRDKIIISSGGVITPEDVLERLHLGADLVQVYTALALKGPSFFSKMEQAFRSKNS